MKLFSWLNDSKGPSIEGDDSAEPEPSISPILESRLSELEKIKVSDVMTPRALVHALDIDVQLRRARRLKSAKVAFFPVYKGDLDNIKGWISKTRALELLAENSEENHLEQFIRPVGSITDDATAADLADIFLKSASPFLVVKNSVGNTVGIMTLSEFVELIFGFELGGPAAPATPETIQSARNYDL